MSVDRITIVDNLIDTENYICGHDNQGLFYEGFYNLAYPKTVFLLPGDCFGSWAFRNLALDLYSEKINIFLLNYDNDRSYYKRVNNNVYLQNVKAQVEYIKLRHLISEPPSGEVYYLGFSRGTLLVQMYHQQFDIDGGIILVAPMFSIGKNSVDSIPLAIEVLFKCIFKEQFKLSYKQFVRRFFSPNLDDQIKRYLYQMSNSINRYVLWDNVEIDYTSLRQKKMMIILLKDDRAVNYQQLSSQVEILKNTFCLDIVAISMDGYHCDLITNPRKFLGIILEFIYGNM